MQMRQHITIVAVLKIGFSALTLLIAGIVFLAIVGGGLISGDEDAIAITSVVGSVIAGFLVLISLPGIIGGFGLLRYKPWARYLVLILAVLDLINIPVGTAIGIYTIWVLMQPQTEQLFGSRAGAMANLETSVQWVCARVNPEARRDRSRRHLQQPRPCPAR